MEDQIDVKNVKRILNTRTEIGDISELMQDIEHRGLIYPIEVYQDNDGKFIVVDGNSRFEAVKNLGWTHLKTGTDIKIIDRMGLVEHLERNLAENIHRAEISPIEVGAAIAQFMKLGLNKSAISIKLHKSLNYIDSCLKLYNGVPQKYRNRVGEIKGSSNKKGKIPMTIASKLSTLIDKTMSKEDGELLWDSVYKEELTESDLNIIRALVREGATVPEAIKKRNKFKAITLSFVVSIVDKEKLEEKVKQSITKIIREDTLNGKYKDIFFRG